MSAKKHKVRAISISGGGIKGIIPAYLLCELEKILQEKTGSSDERLMNHVDLISGTSIGGIMSALFSEPLDTSGRLRSAKEVYDIVIDACKAIFYETPSNGMPVPVADYSSKQAEQYSQKVFKNLELKDLVKPTLITAYEPNRHWMTFFRQQHAAIDPAANFLVSDVCRATMALPGYFDPVTINSFSNRTVTENSFFGSLNRDCVDIAELLAALKSEKIINEQGEILVELNRADRREFNLPEKWHNFEKIIFSVLERIKNPSFTFLDGAVFANNPSLCTLVEVGNTRFKKFGQERPTVEETILISLGTGIVENSELYSAKIDARFTTKFMNLLFDCAESLAHFQCMHAFSAAGVINQYYYLDPVIRCEPGKTVPTANFYDTRPDNIKALEELTAKYAERKRPYLQKIVDSLLAEKSD